MSKIKLEATKRDPKENARAIVTRGPIPAVVYDQKGNSTSIQIDNPKIQNILASVTPTTLIELSVEGGDPHLVLVKEVFTNPRTEKIHHISFMSLDPSKKAVFPVNITLTGEAPAVRNNLGVLLFTKQFLELRGFPKDMPESISLDISTLLDVGDTFTVADLKIPAGLEFIHDSDKHLAIATIRPFQKAEELEEKPAEEGEEGAEGEASEEGETGEEGKAVENGKEGVETREKGEKKPAESTKHGDKK